MPLSATTVPTAALSGTFLLGGDLPVHRLGFGAMRITGEGVWGPPADKAEAIATLRRAMEAANTLVDTAEWDGPRRSGGLNAHAVDPDSSGVAVSPKGRAECAEPAQGRRTG